MSRAAKRDPELALTHDLIGRLWHTRDDNRRWFALKRLLFERWYPAEADAARRRTERKRAARARKERTAANAIKTNVIDFAERAARRRGEE